MKEMMMKNLRLELENQKISKKKLSKKMSVSLTTIYNWINGITFPNIEQIAFLCDYLSINMHELIIDEITEKEYWLISQYRNDQDFQLIIDKLLNFIEK